MKIKREKPGAIIKLLIPLAAILLLLFCSNLTKAGSCTEVTIEYQDNSAGRAGILIKGVSLSQNADGVSVAVWSRGDQKDLYWYDAVSKGNGNYYVDIDIANHNNNYGLYYVDVYDSGAVREISYLDGITVRFEKPSDTSTPASYGSAGADVTNVSSLKGTCDVTINGVIFPETPVKVKMAAWSQKDQSDLYWYTMKDAGNGSYTAGINIANHNGNYGEYIIHIYGVGSDGADHFLGQSTVCFKKDSNVITVGKSGQNYEAVVSDVETEGEITDAQFAFWTKENGQDDLTWRTGTYNAASNTLTANINEIKFLHDGPAYLHIYYKDSRGKSVFLAGTTFNVEHTGAKTVYSQVVVNNKTGWFNVTIDGSLLDSKVKTVRVPVWSRSDQSDLVWYTATRNAKGDYVVDASIANHNYNIGKYYLDIYTVDTYGTRKFLETQTMTFKADGNPMTVTTKDHRYYELYIGGLQVPGGFTEASFAVWSQEVGQDDLTWVDASYNATLGYMKATFDTNDLKHTGNVIIHSFVRLKNGNNQFIVYGGFQYTGIKCSSVTFENKNDTAGTCTMKINEASAPEGIKAVRVAAWSKADQSDLYWYTAKNTGGSNYSVVIDTANHKNNAGQYLLDLYITDNTGKSTFVVSNSLVFKAPEKTVSVVNKDKQYQITLSGVYPSDTVKTVAFALWTAEGGQDDLIWVDGEYDSAGKKFTAGVSESKLLHDGKAYLDVYTKDASGKGTCILSITFNAEKTISPAEAVTVKSDRSSGGFSVEIDKRAVKSTVATIKVPVWSQKDQSDLVWYTASLNADGNYAVESNISSHKYNTGTYYVDVYTYDSAGKRTYFTSKTMDFNAKYSRIEVSGKDNSNYKLTVSGVDVPGGVSSIAAAVWSVEGGQDDLKWYSFTGSNGVYTADIDLDNHMSLGAYIADLYVNRIKGNSIYLATCTDIVRNGQTKANVTIENVDNLNGFFDVRAEIANSDLKKVLVPVWTQEDQSDIKWYVAEKTGVSTYKVRIDVKNHNDYCGIYRVHVYGQFSDGSLKVLGSHDQAFEINRTLAISPADGSSTRTISFRSDTASRVRFAVWTKTGGQDDIIWYDAVSKGNGVFTASVPASNHKHNGIYYVHVYADGAYAAKAEFSIINYVEYALRIAADDSIGYSQLYRKMNPDVDCSSFVYYALYNNGFAAWLGTTPFSTATEVSLLQKAGFEVIAYTGMTELKPGDILWYRNGTGHTEIYVENGMMVGAHDSVVDGIDYPQGGDQTGREVSLEAFRNPGWMSVLRYYD